MSTSTRYLQTDRASVVRDSVTIARRNLVRLVRAPNLLLLSLVTGTLFVLTFLSSAFVPIDTMPGWLQVVARVNPVTAAVDALRALLVGGSVPAPLVQTMLWVTGILVLLVTLGVFRYGRGS